MYVGITLLYSFTERSNYFGALKSYVIDCIHVKSIIDSANNKAKEQIDRYFPSYSYLGLEDVFVVSGKAIEGEVLGRSSFYNLNVISESKELIKEIKDYSVFKNSSKLTCAFCVSVVYFYENVNMEDSFTFSILTIIEDKNVEGAIAKANLMAISDRFLKRIAPLSVEELNTDRVKYIGIEDVFLIEEDFKNGGSFQTFYSKDYSSEKELLKLLPSTKELNEIMEDVFNAPTSAASPSER
ncbi:MAG: hypothetical protein JW801_16120 [Bacteroidales bacterium]|nr:hypothetical protein [Bacteroidales bacterium]